MLWRSLFIFIVATHVRRAEKKEDREEVKLMLEQPPNPGNRPEVVTLWRTQEWKRMEEIYELGTKTFNQGDWGGVGVPVKPTTIEETWRWKSQPTRTRIPDPEDLKPGAVPRSCSGGFQGS